MENGRCSIVVVGGDTMLVDHALRIKEGVIRHKSECFICKTTFEWYAPFDMNQHAKHNGLALAEIIVDNTNITDGREVWADVNVLVNCAGCGIKNKFQGIKIKLK
jgi:hypothetical protein